MIRFASRPAVTTHSSASHLSVSLCVAFVCFGLLTAGCAESHTDPGAAAKDTSVTNVTPKAAEIAATNGDGSAEKATTYIIDVRSDSEFAGGHIKDAHHIPHTEIGDRIGEVTDDKKAKIIVYCAAGVRSGKAKVTLESIGFTNVENGGGYDDMQTLYPTE